MRLLLLALFLLAEASSFGQQLSLSLSSGSAAPGAAVSLSISLGVEGSVQPASLQWTLKYVPEDFDSVQVAASPAATSAAKNLRCNASAGSVSCLLIGLNTNPLSSGVVAIATFQVASGAAHQTSAIQLTDVAAASPQASTIPANGTGASVAIQGSASATGPANAAKRSLANNSASRTTTSPNVLQPAKRSTGHNGASANQAQNRP